MPTYDYRCEGCCHEFEEFQSFSAAPLKTCPKCGEDRLRRLFGTGAAVLFKGSGFYETDYRSESYKKSAKADQEASKPAASSSPPAGDTGSTPSTPTPSKDAGSGGKGSKSSG
jgi:putative FmdB family regulatory protein